MGVFIARRFPKHALWNDDATALRKPDGSELVALTAAQVQAVQALVSDAWIRRAREKIGTQAWSWVTSPPTFVHAGTTPSSIVADKSLGDTGVLRIPYSAGTRAGTKTTLAAPIDLSARTVIRVVLRNNGTATRLIQMRIGANSGYTVAAYFYLACNPGVNVFMIDTYSGSMQGGMTWPVNGATCQYFWFVDTSAVEAGYSNLTAGDSIDVGLITTGATSRPMFMFVADDCKAGTVTRHTDYPIGYPQTGGTHLDIISAYGFRAATNLSVDDVDEANFVTTAQAHYLESQGWQVNINTNLPLTGAPYGSYDLVLAELRRQQVGLAALGFSHTDAMTGVPTGAIAQYVYQALYDAGISVARLVSAQTAAGGIYRPFGHVCGQNGGFYSIGAVAFWSPPGMCVVNNSFQVDGSLTTGDVDAYVAALKLNGGIGSCYVHDVTADSATLLDYLCAKIRAEVDSGAMDVVLPSELRDIYRAVEARHRALYV